MAVDIGGWPRRGLDGDGAGGGAPGCGPKSGLPGEPHLTSGDIGPGDVSDLNAQPDAL